MFFAQRPEILPYTFPAWFSVKDSREPLCRFLERFSCLTLPSLKIPATSAFPIFSVQQDSCDLLGNVLLMPVVWKLPPRLKDGIIVVFLLFISFSQCHSLKLSLSQCLKIVVFLKIYFMQLSSYLWYSHAMRQVTVMARAEVPDYFYAR